jgi:hypothetical protein
MNFRVYRITFKNQGEIKKAIILSREKLNVADKIFARHIDENVYFTQKTT